MITANGEKISIRKICVIRPYLRSPEFDIIITYVFVLMFVNDVLLFRYLPLLSLRALSDNVKNLVCLNYFLRDNIELNVELYK